MPVALENVAISKCKSSPTVPKSLSSKTKLPLKNSSVCAAESRPPNCHSTRIGLDVVGSVSHAYRTRNPRRSEEHTHELKSLMLIPYADFCFTKKKYKTKQ